MKKIEQNGVVIALAEETDGRMDDVQSALDLAMCAKYELGAQRIAVDKRAVANAFFILSSGMAGEILQKFINYQIKMAIYGDYSGYTSKPLHDFMYESNKGKDFFFVGTQEEATERLSKA